MSVVKMSNLKALAQKKRQIEIRPAMADVTDEALEALGRARAGVYHRGCTLVRVVRETKKNDSVVRDSTVPRIEVLPAPRLRELLSDAAEWGRIVKTKNGELQWQPQLVPKWVVEMAMARGTWSEIPRLFAVVETPVLRPDGTILFDPGYDSQTELLLLPNVLLDGLLNDAPTLDDAIAARDFVLEAVCDFPFASPEHQASWLAYVLTPFARFAYEGPTPLFLIDGNLRAVGKGLLVDAGHAISIGRSISRMPPSEKEAEERKRITSVAMAGDRVVLIDNIAGSLGTAALDAALTATRWKDRILGTNTTFDGPLNTIWVATGNNVELVGDTPRRVCHIRLETQEENPENRENFKHPELIEWIADNRPALVAAALTILRAYCRAGRPQQSVRSWGSFEGWNRLVASSVVWVGMADPNLARDSLVDLAQNEANALADLLHALEKLDRKSNGVTCSEIARLSDEKLTSGLYEFPELRAALEELVTTKNNQFPSARSIGAKFRRIRRRVVGGKYIDRVGEKTAAGLRWVVRQIETSDSSDSSDCGHSQENLENKFGGSSTVPDTVTTGTTVTSQGDDTDWGEL